MAAEQYRDIFFCCVFTQRLEKVTFPLCDGNVGWQPRPFPPSSFQNGAVLLLAFFVVVYDDAKRMPRLF
jgi:hypothetical protein